MKKTIIILAILTFTLNSCKKEAKNTSETIETSKKQEPVERLMSGNERFLNEKSIHPHQNKKTILANQNGQHPFAVVLTCSDSRVSPEIIFDQGIGDLFIIRNAGNLISNIDMGSIEYAVEHLNVSTVIVLGHTECGAITAYVSDTTNNYKKHLSHIDDIVEMIANEKEEKTIHKKNHLEECIDANIKHSTKLIKENPIMKEHGTKIIAMRYDVHTAKVIKM